MSEANYSKRSFDAVLVTDDIAENAAPAVAGMFYYLFDKDKNRVGISSCLPNAKDIGEPSWGATMFKGHGSPSHEWSWDGNRKTNT